MIRRTFLAVALVMGFASPSFADSSISVVKIINFTCPVCRASEVQDAAIHNAASMTGGTLVVAPMPNETGTYARERVYYAVRNQGTFAETAVRESLYRAAQDMGLPLSDIPQVIEWLKDDIPNAHIDWVRLASDAQSKEAQNALGRAASLSVRAGSQSLPSYIIVKDNAPVATLDLSSTGKGNSLLALREEVIARIKQHSAQK